MKPCGRGQVTEFIEESTVKKELRKPCAAAWLCSWQAHGVMHPGVHGKQSSGGPVQVWKYLKKHSAFFSSFHVSSGLSPLSHWSHMNLCLLFTPLLPPPNHTCTFKMSFYRWHKKGHNSSSATCLWDPELLGTQPRPQEARLKTWAGNAAFIVCLAEIKREAAGSKTCYFFLASAAIKMAPS